MENINLIFQASRPKRRFTVHGGGADFDFEEKRRRSYKNLDLSTVFDQNKDHENNNLTGQQSDYQGLTDGFKGRERSSTISPGNWDAMEQLKQFQKIHMIGARNNQTQTKTQILASKDETRHIQYEFEKPSVPKYRRSSIPYVHLLEEAINTKPNKTMTFVEIMK